jgi:hypothetical protein
LDNYLFDWEHGSDSLTEYNKHKAFKPMFVTFTSVKGYTIGVNFPCDGWFVIVTCYNIKYAWDMMRILTEQNYKPVPVHRLVLSRAIQSF